MLLKVDLDNTIEDMYKVTILSRHFDGYKFNSREAVPTY